jgi:lysophospholipase L1-like esterase
LVPEKSVSQEIHYPKTNNRRSFLKGALTAGIAATGLSRTGVTAATPDFELRDGDTVVFYGDSITNQKLYAVYTEAFVLTRFPQMRIRFVQSGWSGDRVSGGGGGTVDQRLERDVFPYRPTVVTVMLGMNDGEYRPYDSEVFRKYADGYLHIVDRIKAELPDARLTVMEPSAYDDVTRPAKFDGGYNAVLVRYGEYVRQLARSKGLREADMNRPVVALLQTANKLSSQLAQQLIPDRVHPSPGVHLVMAATLLRAWNAPPVVSAVEIDASKGSVLGEENATVDSVQLANGLTWSQVDKALPMPTESQDGMIELALRCSDFTERLNQETLRVTGLAAGAWQLMIDEEPVGMFQAAQLAHGINLAPMQTPMLTQAMSVLRLTYKHNYIHFARWAMLETSLEEYNLPRTPTAIKMLDELETDVVSLQRSAAKPKAHRYRLIRQ